MGKQGRAFIGQFIETNKQIHENLAFRAVVARKMGKKKNNNNFPLKPFGFKPKQASP
jgi:hypothetical protein